MSAKYSRLLERVAPGTVYKNGFSRGADVEPFYAAGECAADNWSGEMDAALDETGKNHFLDVYNRRLTLDSLDKALSASGARYLDAGCSSGHLLSEAAARWPSALVCGCDNFSAGLARCHDRLPGVPLFRVDLSRRGVGTEEFDALSCLNVLEHIKDDLSALSNMRKMLKPGGLLAVTVPLGPALFDLYDEAHFHERRYTLAELRGKLERAGFTVRYLNALGFFIYPAFYLAKKFNRLRFAGLSSEEKQKRAFAQMKIAQRSPVMEKLCALEYSLSKKLKYPCGVRGFALAEK